MKDFFEVVLWIVVVIALIAGLVYGIIWIIGVMDHAAERSGARTCEKMGMDAGLIVRYYQDKCWIELRPGLWVPQYDLPFFLNVLRTETP